jgi:hypothetical protein
LGYGEDWLSGVEKTVGFELRLGLKGMGEIVGGFCEVGMYDSIIRQDIGIKVSGKGVPQGKKAATTQKSKIPWRFKRFE